MRPFESRLLAPGLVLVGLAVGAATASADCLDLVEDSAYLCTLKLDTPGGPIEVQSCFDFDPPGAGLGGVDLGAQGIGDLTCACTARGRFKDPKFNRSNKLQCVAKTGSSPAALHGRVSRLPPGQKIRGGHGVDELGNVMVFKCVRDLACNTAP